MIPPKPTKQPQFWIVNVSNLNVTLADLALVVPAGKSWDLLDSKHFHYTAEQLEKSATTGSIFKKFDKIKLRKVAPKPVPVPGIYVSKDTSLYQLRTHPRSQVKIEQKTFEELEVLDEEFASEAADVELAPQQDKKD